MSRGPFDVQSPLLKPLWLRLGIVAACLAWAAVELSRGAVFWAIVFGAAGAYLAYQFFIVWDPEGGDEP
ncbi:MAG: hypothetical protein QNJ16_01115 [Rhodobacter sp.]|nr:hypothetical protein [Rhodobacter sp.]